MSAATDPIASNVIAQDLPCVHCGYNLRALSSTSLCPECGTPIPKSAEHLRAARPFNFARLALGAAILVAYAAVILGVRYVPIGELYGGARFFTSVACNLLSSALLSSGAIVIAASATGASTRNRQIIFAMAASAFALGLPWEAFRCLLRLKIIHKAPLPMFAAFDALACAKLFLEGGLLVAGWCLMTKFARQFQRPGIFVALTWITIPACSLLVLYQMFIFSLDMADCFDLLRNDWIGFLHSESSELPAFPFYMAHAFYWSIVAIIAFRISHWATLPHNPSSQEGRV